MWGCIRINIIAVGKNSRANRQLAKLRNDGNLTAIGSLCGNCAVNILYCHIKVKNPLVLKNSINTVIFSPLPTFLNFTQWKAANLISSCCLTQTQHDELLFTTAMSWKGQVTTRSVKFSSYQSNRKLFHKQTFTKEWEWRGKTVHIHTIGLIVSVYPLYTLLCTLVHLGFLLQRLFNPHCYVKHTHICIYTHTHINTHKSTHAQHCKTRCSAFTETTQHVLAAQAPPCQPAGSRAGSVTLVSRKHKVPPTAAHCLPGKIQK